MKFTNSNSLTSTFRFEIPKNKFRVLRKIWVEDEHGNNITKNVISASFMSCDIVPHYLSRLAIKTFGNDEYLPFFFTEHDIGLPAAYCVYHTQVFDIKCKNVGHVVLCMEGDDNGIKVTKTPPPPRNVVYNRHVTTSRVKLTGNKIKMLGRYTPCAFKFTPSLYYNKLPSKVTIIHGDEILDTINVSEDGEFYIKKMDCDFNINFDVPYFNYVDWVYPNKWSAVFSGGVVATNCDEIDEYPVKSNKQGEYFLNFE